MKLNRDNLFDVIGWAVFVILISDLAIWCLTLTAHSAQQTNAPKAVVGPPPLPTTNRVPSVVRPLALATPSTIKTVTFTWDPPPNTNVTGWNFYQVYAASNSLLGSVVTNTITITGVDLSMTNVFGVTATDVFSNESAMSATLAVSFPSAPFNLHIQKITP